MNELIEALAGLWSISPSGRYDKAKAEELINAYLQTHADELVESVNDVVVEESPKVSEVEAPKVESKKTTKVKSVEAKPAEEVVSNEQEGIESTGTTSTI